MGAGLPGVAADVSLRGVVVVVEGFGTGEGGGVEGSGTGAGVMMVEGSVTVAGLAFEEVVTAWAVGPKFGPEVRSVTRAELDDALEDDAFAAVTPPACYGYVCVGGTGLDVCWCIAVQVRCEKMSVS